MSQDSPDELLMRRAIELAQSADLSTDINPHVGAIVVSPEGDVVGEGFHQGSGTDHAEVVALAQAGPMAVGATVYSTLEPCSSTGRRGPCTQALIEVGVARVVYGQSDPNPLKAGGAAALATSGVTVVGGILSGECEALNASWTFAHSHNRPWVIWKTATTLDGFVASVDGTSKWITSEESRNRVQEIRASVGAIVTGTGTVLADNPLLTVRERPADQQPLRVIVGRRDISADSYLLSQPHPAIRMDSDISDVLNTLWTEHHIHRVLIEAGPGLSRSCWKQGLVDEVFWFQAPTIFGNGKPVLGDVGVQTLADASRFADYTLNRVGLDVLIHFTTRQDG